MLDGTRRLIKLFSGSACLRPPGIKHVWAAVLVWDLVNLIWQDWRPEICRLVVKGAAAELT